MAEMNLQTSKSSLIKSLVAAIVIAVVLLFVVVLPAEYGVDQTGLGSVLGLKDLSNDQRIQIINNPLTEDDQAATTLFHALFEEPLEFHDVTIELVPFGQAEYKFHMSEDTTLAYHWQTDGGMIYADAHGHKMVGDEELVVQYLDTQEAIVYPVSFEHPLKVSTDGTFLIWRSATWS